MTWKKLVNAIESQGVDDETEMSFILLEGGYYPDVTIHRPDPDDSDYKVADITQGEHENDVAVAEFNVEELDIQEREAG